MRKTQYIAYYLQPDDSTYEEVPEPASQAPQRRAAPPEPEEDDDYETVETKVPAPAPAQPEPAEDLYENVAEVTAPAVRLVTIVIVA